ncbi:MAG: hypothetical protein V1936_03590 [Patescibacteria group bacterium]
MNSSEQISILICHCSFPQELTKEVRLALEAATGLKLMVKIFRPTQHKRYLTEAEIRQDAYWPVEKTRTFLKKIFSTSRISLTVFSESASAELQGVKNNLDNSQTALLWDNFYDKLEDIDKIFRSFFQSRGYNFDPSALQELKIRYLEITLREIDALRKEYLQRSRHRLTALFELEQKIRQLLTFYKG